MDGFHLPPTTTMMFGADLLQIFIIVHDSQYMVKFTNLCIKLDIICPLLKCEINTATMNNYFHSNNKKKTPKIKSNPQGNMSNDICSSLILL